MINTEQAVDMLPLVVDLYEKLDIENYRHSLAEKNKGKQVDQMSVGLEVFKYILKNAGKVKEEAFGIVAITEGKTIEEIRKQSFTKTIIALKAIFSDKETIDFFKQAVQ